MSEFPNVSLPSRVEGIPQPFSVFLPRWQGLNRFLARTEVAGVYLIGLTRLDWPAMEQRNDRPAMAYSDRAVHGYRSCCRRTPHRVPSRLSTEVDINTTCPAPIEHESPQRVWRR